MSPGEVGWRLQSAVRDAIDPYRLRLKLYPRANRVRARALTAGPRWCPVPLGDWRDLAADDPAAIWRARLVERADRIAAHRLSFFDLDQVDLGHPIDWNREHANGRPTPMTFASTIDYRDYAATGDAKVVWEPNRHHQLVVLGRAYRATADPKYAAAVLEQIDSWIAQCPFGFGMNWRSPLELAVRVVNWVWAVDLIADSGLATEAFESRLLQSVALHVWDIARKYSRGSSANNHRIGEACGVLTATSYFPELPDAARLREESRRILSEEILEQTYASGATCEQAFGYQLFVLQLFLYAGLAARRSGEDFAPPYWSRLERMFEFVEALADGGPPPMFGDSDDGYVLDLGNAPSDAGSLTEVAAAVFRRPAAGGSRAVSSETVHWLFGSTPRSRREAATAAAQPRELESRAFEDAGLYLLQWGRRDSRDRVSVVFDCGELGFGALAAHGHADALSIVVRAFGVDLLVDPGTYDYFSAPEWRRYFRSTRAHNTVTLDGEDQSVQLGSFLWGRRAAARLIRWTPRPGGGIVEGQHDGYAAEGAGAICRRALDLDRASRTLTIADEIVAEGPHDVAVFFHLSEQCDIRQKGHRISIDCGPGRAVLSLDDRLAVSTSKGAGVDAGGWVSRGYHRKAPAWTICGRVRSAGQIAIRSLLTIEAAG